ncbi:TrkH family potassium uptake protein [Halapricum desulfuricans]|uniref:Trk-type K+ transport system, membrane component n=1 Tax=Halapricum desulfuricans TaxID=2841257 RepID=A0A897N4X2_9EURY|nr:TrkH family potassium uptake protein [Halapricum desulfuricans]QSG05935.1 Trk-type K+ transport system, membrane component [Halapricum desulfuricans]
MGFATGPETCLRVDWRASLSLVGSVLKYLSVPLLFPLLVGLRYGEGIVPFVATIAVVFAVGAGLERLDPDPDLGAREGFLMVALTWLSVAVVGTFPYLIAGTGTLAQPVNALFESMSGFTTTGATVMGSIGTDKYSHSILLWRQLTQWLGGMGIVVLAVAILPELSVGGAQLMDAEAPGPGIEKLTPRIRTTARALWLAYLGFTVLEFALLYGLHLAGYAPNMDLYNAVSHPLTTMPTGGFSPEARSIEAFSAAVQWVIIPFMIAAGTNFALFWKALKGDFRVFGRDSEFRFYAGVIGALTAVLAGLLFAGAGVIDQTTDVAPMIGEVENSLRHGAFQTVSIVTTTGYASIDFNFWESPAKYLLVFAMFIGGSAGSTGGAIKIVRWLVILKSIKRELFTTVHPEAVRPVRLGGRALDERALRGIYAFTLLYLVAFFVGVALLVIDSWAAGYVELALIDAVSAVAATLGNVGPGLGEVGPMGNYLSFPVFSKLLMIFLMWVGRLEILPVFVLLTRAYWQS